MGSRPKHDGRRRLDLCKSSQQRDPLYLGRTHIFVLTEVDRMRATRQGKPVSPAARIEEFEILNGEALLQRSQQSTQTNAPCDIAIKRSRCDTGQGPAESNASMHD